MNPDDWDRGASAVHRYVAVRGYAVISAEARVAGFDLGRWVVQCRREYWAGDLPATQQAVLTCLPGWSWGTPGRRRPPATPRPPQRWTAGLAAATGYVAAHGSLSAVQPDTVHDGFALGRWVVRCRLDFREGTMPGERVTVLEVLPGWRWGPLEVMWHEGLAVLRHHVDLHGHAHPAQATVLDGFPVGSWVKECRHRYRAGTLRPDRAEVLSSLPGWWWNAHLEGWRTGLTAVIGFGEQHGHVRPGRAVLHDGYPVGRWVATQQALHRRGTLAPARARLLEEVPGWTWLPVRPPSAS